MTRLDREHAGGAATRALAYVVVAGFVWASCLGERVAGVPLGSGGNPRGAGTASTAAPRSAPSVGGIPREQDLPARPGHLSVTATDARRNVRIPARLIVRGALGTSDPELGPEYRATGAGRIVIAMNGDAVVPLPSGTYDVSVSHGPEWTLHRARVSVEPTHGASIRAALSRVWDMSDWTACDLHVHALPSFDSQVPIEDRVASLVAEGIEFAVPSEHNVIGDYGAGVRALPLAALDALGGRGLSWVPAVEITTDHAPRRIGHFNVYPFRPLAGSPDGSPPPFAVPPREIFRAVRARAPEAIIQVNHPRMNDDNGYFHAMGFEAATGRATDPAFDDTFDAIEVWNGYDLGNPAATAQVFADWLSLLDAGRRVVATASSDSHNIAFHTAGYPRTYVATPRAGDSAPEPTLLLASLRAGHAFVTNGPLLFVTIDDHGPGQTVTVSGDSVDVHIRVVASPWLDVGEIEVFTPAHAPIRQRLVPGTQSLRADVTIRVPVDRARSYVIAAVAGQREMEELLPGVHSVPFAFSNAIWVQRSPAAPERPRP